MESELFSAMINLTNAHAAGDEAGRRAAVKNLTKAVVEGHVTTEEPIPSLPTVWIVVRISGSDEAVLGVYSSESKATVIASELQALGRNRYRVDKRRVE